MNAPRRNRGALYVVVLSALFIGRLAFAVLVAGRPQLALANDSDRYVPIANAILSGEAYGWNTDRPGELLNTVGYPLFLAAVFATLGKGAADVALGQLVVTGLAAILTYVILSRWLGEIAAFVSALVLMLEPLTILWSMTILTESLFAAIIAASALTLGLWAMAPRRALLFLTGALAAVACLVRPVGLALVAVWAVAVSVHAGALTGFRSTWLWAGIRRGLSFALPSVVLLAPWVIRNALLWDCPTLAPVDRITTRDYIVAKIIVETEHIELEQAQEQLQAEDPGMCPRLIGKYQQMILGNMGTFLRLHAAGTVPVLIATSFDRWLQYFGSQYELPDLWRPFMDGGISGMARVVGQELGRYPQGFGLMLVLTATQIAMYLVAGLGAMAAWKMGTAADRWYAVVLVLGVVILIVTPGQGGHERFRVPVEPLLAILIGYWVSLALTPKMKHTVPVPTLEGV